jgi:hypothetical protein
MKSIFIAIFLVLCSTVLASAQNNWDHYLPRTLDEITATIITPALKDPDVVLKGPKGDTVLILSYNSYPSNVETIYTGEVRKISNERRKVVEFWLTTVGKPKELLDIFAHEYYFTENNKGYWFPVQKQVAEYFEKELKKGDKVSVLLAWIGGRYEGEKFDSIFLMNEFEKLD